MKSKITVNIFGERYSLVTDFDAEYIEKLAQTVDKNMRDVAKKTNDFSGNRIGVLAALQIADEYHKLKRDYDELMALVREN